MSHDDFTSTVEGAAAYEATHGENHQFVPPFRLGSGNVPRLPVQPLISDVEAVVTASDLTDGPGLSNPMRAQSSTSESES